MANVVSGGQVNLGKLSRIRVEFEDIKINTDYQLVEGMVETSYDAEWSGIVDVDRAIKDIGDFVGSLKEIIAQIFDRRNEELDELQELQDQLAEGSITEEEFNERAEEKATNIEKLDDLFGEKLRERILDSPVATQAQKDEVKNLGPTALASTDDLSQTDINNIKTKDAATRKRLEEIADEVTRAEEEMFYDSKEYISKVFQKIRCAYANGSNTLPSDYFDKVGQEFTATFDDYGRITVKLTSEQTLLGSVSHVTQESSSGSGNKTDNYTLFTLDYGGVTITAKSYGIHSNTENRFEKLQNYLFPSDPNTIKEEAETLLAQILAKANLADGDITDLKAIANCGAMYFTVDDKYRIIQKIAAGRSYITEYYEDLILDLIENYSGDIAAYSNAFMEKLENDSQLLEILFKEMDDVTFWKGNEDNFTRFLQVIYGLWQGSSYSNAENYTYVEEQLGTGSLSPYILTYDGESWFPDVEYEPTIFTNSGVQIATRTFFGEHGTMAYQYLQPIWIVFAGNGEGRITKTQVPAIYFAGTAKKDNLQKSLDQIGLTMDVALTLSAIGNFTKLRHLTQLQQVGRIVLGTVEVTSAAADILVRYTELCEGNEDFCDAFQEYNTYLQLGILGSGLLRAKFTASRVKAKTAYEDHREVLINKYGADDARIKELDGHFGVVNEVGRFVAKSGTELKIYLDNIAVIPAGKKYNGNFYKSVSKNAELTHNARPDIISEFSIEEAWGRYDLQGESGMYYSKTLNGNQTEMSNYGDWNSYSTYEFTNVEIDNMLDLTDDTVIKQLGTEFNKLVLTTGTKTEMYEFTNIIGTWARSKGYKGIIVPGARGGQDYTNIVVFNQSDLTTALKLITPIKIK